jgi:hypothetical protein
MSMKSRFPHAGYTPVIGCIYIYIYNIKMLSVLGLITFLNHKHVIWVSCCILKIAYQEVRSVTSYKKSNDQLLGY